ncbi:MAG: ATP-grasp domain-containing protein, partial [bacterium]|nr:ATP-grasp domain-containing protein [bacterium]
ELKVTDSAIHIIEVAARRGADNIGDFLQQVYGIDIYEEAVRIACGEDRHRAHPVPRQHMKMRYFLPQSAGRLVAIHGLDEVRRDPRVSELIVDFQPGDEILVPPAGFEFLGYVSVAGATSEAADAALDEVYDKVSFTIADATQPPAVGGPGAPVDGRLLVVQPSADYAFRVRCHVPGAVFLVSPDRTCEMADYPVIVADLHDLAATIVAVRGWSATAGGLDGITCFVCEHLELTARLAAELQLPFHPLAAVRRSRHKELATQTWQAAGVPVPASQPVGGLSDILDFTQQVAPPWILKPTDRSGSEWVLRVDRHKDLLPAHLRIRDGLTSRDRRRQEPRYLVQELVQGREISADLYIHDGQLVDVLRCTEKWFVDEPGLAGLVGAYYPAQLDAAQMTVLRHTFARAAVALNLSHGIVMVDGILRDGVMYVLEMGLRPGGDCLPELCRLSNGYDPIRSTCQAALGQRPDTGRLDDPNIAAVHLMADCEGTITRLSLDRVRSHPAVLHVDAYRGCGDRLRLWAGSYDDRIVAACMVRFSQATQLATLTRQLTELMEVEVRPTSAPTTPGPPLLEAA